MKTTEFFATHPVFSLDEAANTLAPPGGRMGTVERLKHHLETGRLTLPTRTVYAVVPPGVPASRFRPDPFLVAAAARPDAVFSHHSALELLGAAHTVWTRTTLYTRRRRRSLALTGATVRFLEDPTPLAVGSRRHLGTQRVERRGILLEVTGPERTLVEGFHRPAHVGGLEELVQSASGFPTLDLGLIETVLRRYGVAHLWSATGWFLERFRRTFHVPEGLLDRCERHRPRSPQYLERRRRGGTLAARWRLILPRSLAQAGEPDEP
jgi:predicted transcriptional regulator of viral defense system